MAGRMTRAGRWPLHGRRVGWFPGNPRKAHILIARQGPGGITALLLLVDLGCLGVKDCVVSEELAPGEYDDLAEVIEERMPFPASDPARALKLVQTAAHYASDLGFRPHADFAAVQIGRAHV